MFSNKCSRVATARRNILIAALASLVCICHPVWGQTSPANYAGVLTRWQTSNSTACTGAMVNGVAVYTSPCSTADAFYTPTPDQFGLNLTDWYNNLKTQGVNMGVIYVVLPNDELATSQTITTTSWDNYVAALHIAPASLTTSEENNILAVQPSVSTTSRPLAFTQAQRNYAILQFLTQLNSKFPGYTSTNLPPIQFILDEREWFISNLDADNRPIALTSAQETSAEQTYSGDIAALSTRRSLPGWTSGSAVFVSANMPARTGT